MVPLLLVVLVLSSVLTTEQLVHGGSVDLFPTVQALKTIGQDIKFKGCTYAIDRLFVMACPSQAGLWIADAKSLLDQTNCKENCSGWFDFSPDLSYLALDKEMPYEQIDLMQAQEFSYSGLQTQRNELFLNYIDMQVVEEINTLEKSKTWQDDVG